MTDDSRSRDATNATNATSGTNATNATSGTNATNATRRRFLAVGGAAAATGLAGCSGLDFVLGEGPASFEADVATVSDAALEETGYELNEIEEDTHTETFEVAGESREVQVTSHMAEYDRGVDLFGERVQAAVFTALSTPKVEVLGRTFNPVGDMDSEELAELVQDRYDDVHSVEERSSYTTDVLGEDTRVVQYDAEAELADGGITVDLVMHIADPIEVGDDFVVALGAYPEIVGDGDNVRILMNGVQHPAAGE